MRKFLLTLLLAVLILLPVCAGAATVDNLYVCAGDAEVTTGKRLPDTAIRWYKTGNGQYTLFLPACWDASSLRVYLRGVNFFTVNGVKVNDRETTDCFVPGTAVKLVNGNNAYTVTVLRSENTGSVWLNNDDGNLNELSESKKNRDGGTVIAVDETGAVSFSGRIDYVRLRGNYSFQVDKKSFHIKLPEKTEMLGMKKAKTWLLLANYCDNSMIRDAIAFDLAEGAGMPFAIDYRFVEMYLNNNYYGTFMLTEKVQVGKNRVEIADLEEATEAVNSKALTAYGQAGTNKYKPGTVKYYSIKNDPEDITGGYLMTLELSKRYVSSDSGFVTDAGQAVLLKSPSAASKAQVTYISALVQAFENAISSPDGTDPETGKHYTELADLDSMVNKYLIDEITKNLDGNITSFYVYKYPDALSEKLYFGPVWDYDNSLGVYSSDIYKDILTDPEGLYTGQWVRNGKGGEEYYWFPKLYAHEDFRAAVGKAYRETYRPMLEVLLGLRDENEVKGRLTSLARYEERLTAAAAMNFTRRNTFNGSKRDFPVKTGKNYSENIEYIRDFLTRRMAYLDALWAEE